MDPQTAFQVAAPTVVHSLVRSLPLNVQSGMNVGRAPSGAAAATTASATAQKRIRPRISASRLLARPPDVGRNHSGSVHDLIVTPFLIR